MNAKKISIVICSLTIITTINATCKEPFTPRYKTHGATRFTQFFCDILMDAAETYKNIFSTVSTYKAFVATVPVYAAARMMDHEIHSWFYDYRTHRNINSMGRPWHKLAETWIIRGIAGFALGGLFFAHDTRLRETCFSFLLGLPLVILSSNVIKAMAKGEYCLRPWNGNFSCKERVIGGFPSTHAAQVAFATTLFGMQEGIPAAVPLGILSTYVLVAFINDSRHYLSQIVGGAGLGIVHALATSKIVESKLAQKLDIGLDFDVKGNPAIKVGFNF
jgi:hypothetical protein